MRTLVTGDLHLTARPSEEYRWAIFDHLQLLQKKFGVENLVLLGDITDHKDRHPARLVNRLIDTLMGLSFNILWVPGNHDFADPTVPFFRWVRNLDHVRFYDKPTQISFGAMIAQVLPSTKKPSEEWNGLLWEQAEVIFMHQPVKGAVTSNGTTLGDDDPEAAGLVEFLRTRTHAPIYSGDIHVPQKRGPIIYLGAPHPVRFGDSYSPRVGLITVDREKKLHKFESIPVPSIQRLSLEVGPDDDLDAAFAGMRSGDHVKVSVFLPRSDYGTWPSKKAGLLLMCKERGLQVHGLSLRAAEAAEAPATRTAPLKPTARPERQIARFLKDRAVPDAEALAKVGEDLFTKGNGQGDVKGHLPGDLTLQSLKIQGFKSIKHPLLLRFDNKEPGLYLLSGRNEVEPKLGANGCGKSSIWAGLCFGLWGKTDRGVFGPSLVNWDKDVPCLVEVKLRKEGLGKLSVHRSQSPNVLRTLQEGHVGWGVATNEELEAKLGRSLDEFLLESLHGQFGQYFLDKNNIERLEVFSNALGLGVWERASDAASERGKELSSTLSTQQNDLAKAYGKQESAEESAERAATRLKEAAELLVALDKQRPGEATESGIEKLEKALDYWKGKRKEHHEQVATIDKEAAELDKDERAFLDDTFRPVSSKLAVAEAAVSAASKARGKLISAGECPACQQPVPASHVAKLQAAADKLERKRIDEYNAALIESSKADEARAKLDSRRLDLRMRRKKVSNLEEGCGNEAAEAQQALDDARRAYHKSSEEKKVAALSFEQAEKAVEAAKGYVREAKRLVVSLEKDQAKTLNDMGAVEYWKKGFRELRYWLIGEALEELTIESNNALEQLGLEGWQITFDVERLTGSGGVSRGFHAFVKSPKSPEQVPWEAWSGGEGQRLRIGVDIAMGNLIGARTGVRTSIEVWDEPTAHLSEEGVQDVIAFMAERARSEKKQIWIVDHHSFAHGSFTSEYTVVKNQNGSRLERKKTNVGE